MRPVGKQLRAKLILVHAGHEGNLAIVENFPPLSHNGVSIRPLRRRDARWLQRALLKDRKWLSPWEATLPGTTLPVDARSLISALLHQQRKGSGLAFVITYQGRPVGQLNVANILRGSVSSATIGYWIASEAAGKSTTPISVTLCIDYLFDAENLHRVEIDIRPENSASLRVVEKLKLRHEGLKERYIHIDGAWRDHLVFAITREERRGSMLGRLDNTPSQ